MVKPRTADACNAALTSSSLNGLMTAVMSFIVGCPFASPYLTIGCGRFTGPVGVCRRSETPRAGGTSVFRLGPACCLARRLACALARRLACALAQDGVDEGFRVERGQV